jgi:hypothetical protein
MKPHLSWVLFLLLFAALPTSAVARLHGPQITGEVTAAEKTTITIKGSKRSTTISVPPGTPIQGGESDSTLADLIGKHVRVKEKSPGVAKEIIVKGQKKAKKTKTS